MGLEGIALNKQENQGEKIVYETEMAEVSKEMEKLGFGGFFSVSVEDDGDSFLVSANAQVTKGADPLDSLPTTAALPKDQYSFEDAKKAADKMRDDLLAGIVD